MATSLLLSLELMYLLKWLIKHDKSRLRVLISHALKHGLGRQLHEYARAPQRQPKNTDDAYPATRPPPPTATRTRAIGRRLRLPGRRGLIFRSSRNTMSESGGSAGNRAIFVQPIN